MRFIFPNGTDGDLNDIYIYICEYIVKNIYIYMKSETPWNTTIYPNLYRVSSADLLARLLLECCGACQPLQGGERTCRTPTSSATRLATFYKGITIDLLYHDLSMKVMYLHLWSSSFIYPSSILFRHVRKSPHLLSVCQKNLAIETFADDLSLCRHCGSRRPLNPSSPSR